MVRLTALRTHVTRRVVLEVACLVIVLLGAAGSLALRAGVPVWAFSAFYDDSLFVRQAGSLADGRWLGTFDSMTLAKGPFYPMFMAFTANAGVPLKVAEQAVYLLAVLCIALAIRLITRRPIVATAAFLVLAFSPVNYGGFAARVIREDLYGSLALLVIAAFFLTVYSAAHRANPVWTALAATLTGLSAAAFALSREETSWILPPLLVVLALLPLPVLRRQSWGERLSTAGRLVAAVGLVGLIAWAPIADVAAQNERDYGSALTNDMAQGEFARAYNAWQGVDVGPRRQYVPISAAARAAVYRVSPAAAELEPKLEGPSRWISASCSNVGVCDDLSGAFTVWALREAAAAAHYTSGAESQQYFGRIADEIDAACVDGRLTCQITADPTVRLLEDAQYDRVQEATLRGFDFLLGEKITAVTALHPPVPPKDRWAFHALVPEVPATQRLSDESDQRFVATRLDGYVSLAAVYERGMPVLLGLGVLGLVFAWIRRSPAAGTMTALTAALATGTLARLVVLAIVDTTNFPTVERTYQVSSYTLLLAAGVVGAAQLFAPGRAKVDKPLVIDLRDPKPADVEVVAAATSDGPRTDPSEASTDPSEPTVEAGETIRA